MPETHDWKQTTDADALLRRVADAVAAGEMVVLPSEIGHVLLANRWVSDAGNSAHGWFDPNDFLTSIDATLVDRALASRLWPGPVGWMDDDGAMPAWVPRHAALAGVLAKLPAKTTIHFIEAGCNPSSFEAVAAFIVTDAVTPSTLTLVRPRTGGCDIVRPGAMSAEDIRDRLARRILFVCTGNTCRSPMAEALFKKRLADRLGCSVGELPSRGYVVESAGVSAFDGDAATTESAEAVGYHGGDLSGHRSRLATAELVARADDVIAMTRAHLSVVLGRYPVVGGSLRLLCGPEGDLGDPIGRGPDVYKSCAATVARHVDRLIMEMGLT